MPLFVMGIIPSIIGLIIGHGGILSFGIFFSWTAGGDIILLYLLRKLNNDMYVSDHPEKMGFTTRGEQTNPIEAEPSEMICEK